MNIIETLKRALDGKEFWLLDMSKVADDRVHLANILHQLELSKTDDMERKQLFDLLYIIFAEDPFRRK